MNKFSIPDYHLHSSFSADCDTDINEIVKTAMSKGLSSLCFTDHNDLDFPDTPDKIIFDLDIDEYIPKLQELRAKYISSGFDIRIGVEQGVMRTTCDRLNNYSKEHPGLDFIICSSHVVDGGDPYYKESWEYPDGSFKDPEKLYEMYYEDMLYNVQHFTDYNVYGHIDYIFRFGPENNKAFRKVNNEIFKEEYFPKFKDILHEILYTIINNGKGIEINTGSLYRGMDYAHPHQEILKMYKELGGEILTFGSDAHDLEHIGHAFDEAAEIAKAFGFKYYCTFKDMKPEFIAL